jgi:hypothetical protein
VIEEVGRALSINRVNAGRGAAHGQKVLDKYKRLKDIGTNVHYNTTFIMFSLEVV